MDNNFKKFSDLKKKTQEALDDSNFTYGEEKELHYLKERLDSLTFNLQFHNEKLVQTKAELAFIMNEINAGLANSNEVVNDPIDIPIRIKTPTYPND